MNTESWTDDEVKQCIRELKWDGLVTALYELLDLRAKVARLTHECQTARAERDLAREHLANANKAAKETNENHISESG